ncbi:BufA2 family periplasmic bufferin-type metallophore [Novosphingobium taihuense]|uniref:Putative membrane protein n=1 Tax=Novosphingobium taihuense TaxID=260085 RepID=A0A7W7A9Y7_9SPHN|nr:hypothetical protein [Novosphingobium taihuense]MBB4613011.1 putative membrane protein [Novosphingobium taihuense]TWH85155.1 hypothetical protein IQ25_01909 [Novosphingobium taihuense]
MTSIKTSFALAANAAIVAAAIAALPAPVLAAKAKAEVVHCYGVNTCKGTSDCATASNQCKGQNSCKGQGFKALTEKQCAAQGGSLTEPK